MHELAQGVAGVIDDVRAAQFLAKGRLRKCNTGFDRSDRGRALRDAIQKVIDRQRAWGNYEWVVHPENSS